MSVTRTLQEQLQESLGTAYRIERELGGGGMSRVFVALDTTLGRRVVVKVLLPELAAGVSVERFRREIHLAAQLQHPHIVPLLSAGESEGLPYFTMPYVDGESLRARLIRERELPVPEAIRVLRDVASALGYAHERGVVHRDIKPDNVLLSRGTAVVTDFGVAKALTASSEYGTPEAHPGLTSLGVTLGTPHYMAPEQGAGDPAMDHRVDIYAFGATAYEILTGDPPFTGKSPQAILGAHIAGIAKPISSIRPGLPPLLGHVIMKCLEKRPADRPQSADEIVRALDALATPSGGTIPLPAISGALALPSAPAPTRRRMLWATAAGVVVLLGLAGLLVWRRTAEPPSAAPPVAQAPAPEPASTPAPAVQPAPAAVESAPAPAPPLDTLRPERAPATRVRRPPSTEELTLLARLRAEAGRARSLAVEAGVPESVLAQGDASIARAESLTARQRTAAAAAQLSAATTLWSSAAARPRILPAPEPRPESVAVRPEPLRQPAPDTVPAAAPPPPPAPRPTAPPPDPERAIRALFSEYGGAIESRSVDAIRHLYPGLSAKQAREWEDFFAGVGAVQVELNVTELQVAGNSAEARLGGVYVFDNPSTHRKQRESVQFEAQLRREGDRWRITSLR